VWITIAEGTDNHNSLWNARWRREAKRSFNRRRREAVIAKEK
jgi:hypothetical protein